MRIINEQTKHIHTNTSTHAHIRSLHFGQSIPVQSLSLRHGNEEKYANNMNSYENLKTHNTPSYFHLKQLLPPILSLQLQLQPQPQPLLLLLLLVLVAANL